MAEAEAKEKRKGRAVRKTEASEAERRHGRQEAEAEAEEGQRTLTLDELWARRGCSWREAWASQDAEEGSGKDATREEASVPEHTTLA